MSVMPSMPDTWIRDKALSDGMIELAIVAKQCGVTLPKL